MPILALTGHQNGVHDSHAWVRDYEVDIDHGFEHQVNVNVPIFSYSSNCSVGVLRSVYFYWVKLCRNWLFVSSTLVELLKRPFLGNMSSCTNLLYALRGHPASAKVGSCFSLHYYYLSESRRQGRPLLSI